MFKYQDQVYIQVPIGGADPSYHFRKCDAMVKGGTYTVSSLHKARVLELDPCLDCAPMNLNTHSQRYDGYAALDAY